jgi:Fic family protein
MPRRVTGEYRTLETSGGPVRAFVPLPLPPRDPALVVEGALAELHAEALAALGRLAVAGRMVPSTGWFLYGFVRKEAVISSQIEGTQATLRDVAVFEATERAEHPEDVEEVCNYVRALQHARARLREGEPIGTRLLCEAHALLMRGVRGGESEPGTIRTVQNWIGGSTPATARFVPPPAGEVPGALAALESWIGADDPLPPLVRAGVAHAQFETIHPFLDGNGRIGRLLITLLLERWGVLAEPLLYLSYAFRQRQPEYYARLSGVRAHGDWERWVAFYLECVRRAADDGVGLAAALFELHSADRRRVLVDPASTVSAARLVDLLPQHPVVTAPMVCGLLGVTAPTARKTIEIAEGAGVLRETSGRERDRVYSYHAYLRALTGEG